MIGPIQDPDFGSSRSIFFLKKLKRCRFSKKTKINELQPDFWSSLAESPGHPKFFISLIYFKFSPVPASDWSNSKSTCWAEFQNYKWNNLCMPHRIKFINNTYHFIFFKRQHDACLGVIIFNLLYYSYISDLITISWRVLSSLWLFIKHSLTLRVDTLVSY